MVIALIAIGVLSFVGFVILVWTRPVHEKFRIITDKEVLENARPLSHSIIDIRAYPDADDDRHET